jgi:hypothetical protein
MQVFFIGAGTTIPSLIFTNLFFIMEQSGAFNIPKYNTNPAELDP